MLADNVDHDDSEVLHLFQAVGELAFILFLHLFELVLQPAVLLLLTKRVLLLGLKLLTGDLPLSFKHFNTRLCPIPLHGKLTVITLR